jgi:exosortase/archaeosortase family protein
MQFGERAWLIGAYLAAFAAIASALYYIPNYSWLEYATAYHSEQLLRIVGIHATITVTSAGTMLNEFLVDKPCTGIQVVATFAGILIPLPKLSWIRKAMGLVLVTVGVYVANLARIVVQIWVYYAGLFDWTTVHGPGGVALGVISVAALIVLLDRFVPEFGDFVFSLLTRGKR